MESKGQPGVAPVASPLLSSPSADPFCVFRVSPLPHHEMARGVLYIVSFRLRQVHGDQDCIERKHEGEMGPTMMPESGPTCVGSFPHCCVPRLLLLTILETLKMVC
jgi:hypothetical protein